MTPFHKILWAIDASVEPGELRGAMGTLERLVGMAHVIVQPAYVSTVAVPHPNDLSFVQFLRPQVIHTRSSRAKQVVNELLAYASGIRADLVMVSTGSRACVSRVFRGSVVNRLLLRSPIPMMVIGPEVKGSSRFERLLYATHLDARSKQDFRLAVEIAAKFNSKLQVLHLLTRSQRDLEGKNSTAVGEALPRDSHLMTRSRAWVEWASKKGVAVEIIVQDTALGNAEQILRVANQQQVGLILLESRSGSLGAVLKGSTVREIIRMARCPTWLQRLPRKGVVETRKGRLMLKSIQSLSGLGVLATDGEIGKVEQCFFDDEKWAVRYLVVNTGGWLGGRKVLISPISIREVDPTGKNIRVSLTQKQVEQSPDIDTDKPVSRQMEFQYHDYYHWPYYWTGAGVWGMSPYPGGMVGRPYQVASPGPIPPEFSPEEGDLHLRSSQAVRGYGIEAIDHHFGHVEDFIIDDESWSIRYLVIDTVNFWPSKSVILSPHWVDSISWMNRKFRVNLTKERIKSSPEYRPNIPIDREYEEKLFGHYDRAGYWSKDFSQDLKESAECGRRLLF